jgi:excisionase family DNA binding protein
MSSQLNPIIEPLVGLREAAAILNVSTATVTRYAERGEIPAMRLGNRWKFLPSRLDKWRQEKLSSNCSKP